jgi:hypothetical protein
LECTDAGYNRPTVNGKFTFLSKIPGNLTSPKFNSPLPPGSVTLKEVAKTNFLF